MTTPHFAQSSDIEWQCIIDGQSKGNNTEKKQRGEKEVKYRFPSEKTKMETRCPADYIDADIGTKTVPANRKLEMCCGGNFSGETKIVLQPLVPTS